MKEAPALRVTMFVTNSVSIDNRVIKEASTLARAGHDVTVLGLHVAREPQHEKLEGFTIRRVARDRLHGSGAASADPGALTMAVNLAVYAVQAFAHARKCDVYHAHDLPTLPIAWAAARWHRGRLVYDAHELFTEIGRLGTTVRHVLGLAERLLIPRADRTITVNESIARELARRYGVPTPTVIRNCPRVPMPPPSREDSPLRARAGVPSGVPIVLYQGLYTPNRGLENLVQAASSFGRQARLVFLGWGPLLEPLRALARDLQAQDRIVFLDPVPMSELLSYTAGADLGVIPYRNVGLNNYYTSPNKLFEYLVAGVPVVASRFPELIKVVEGLGVGVTFDPDQPADVARAVNALLEDPAACARARASAAQVAPDFTWEHESSKLLDLYESLGAVA